MYKDAVWNVDHTPNDLVLVGLSVLSGFKICDEYWTLLLKPFWYRFAPSDLLICQLSHWWSEPMCNSACAQYDSRQMNLWFIPPVRYLWNKSSPQISEYKVQQPNLCWGFMAGRWSLRMNQMDPFMSWVSWECRSVPFINHVIYPALGHWPYGYDQTQCSF